jgi:hypothetical protein
MYINGDSRIKSIIEIHIFTINESHSMGGNRWKARGARHIFTIN